MARRHIHYESAFEDYVRSRGWPYVPVMERKKIIFSGARVKAFDFLVYRPSGAAWLVDIKGRKFPYETNGAKRYWENWVTQDDLSGLHHWEHAFGPGFRGMLVFAYHLTGPMDDEPTLYVHPFRGAHYAFYGISATDYAAHARRRSASWDTVSLPNKDFRALARPIHDC